MKKYERFNEEIDQELAAKIYKILDVNGLEYSKASDQYLSSAGPAGYREGFAIQIKGIFASWKGRGNEPTIITNNKSTLLKTADLYLPKVVVKLKQLERTLNGYSIELTCGSLNYIYVRVYKR